MLEIKKRPLAMELKAAFQRFFYSCMLDKYVRVIPVNLDSVNDNDVVGRVQIAPTDGSYRFTQRSRGRRVTYYDRRKRNDITGTVLEGEQHEEIIRWLNLPQPLPTTFTEYYLNNAWNVVTSPDSS